MKYPSPMATETPHDLRTIYQQRFAQTAAYRARVWSILAPHLARHHPAPAQSILDLGCGYGEWINSLDAPQLHAMDLNPDAGARLKTGVTFHEQDCTAAWPFPPGSLDLVVTSNFFEHLPTKSALRATLACAREALRPGGRIVALGPNIRHLGGRYWDFFDHHIALSDASLAEAFQIEGFRPRVILPRFLPFTLVGAPRYPLAFLRAYLAAPILWRFFGHQFLLVAEKPA